MNIKTPDITRAKQKKGLQKRFNEQQEKAELRRRLEALEQELNAKQRVCTT